MLDALITISDVKTEAGITTTVEDALLTVLVAAVLSIWDELTDRTWLQATYTDEKHNSDQYNKCVFLKNFPVTSVASLYDDPLWEFGASTLIPTTDYVIDLENGIIYNYYYFNKGRQSIKVTYTAGYTVCPAWLKQILVRQVAHWHQQAVNKRWAVSSVSSKEGTVISFSLLKDNLLPDFVLMIDTHRRVR